MDNSTEVLAPPEPLFSDYIEIAYLSLLVLIGMPSNIIILRRLLIELKKPKDSVKNGFLLLKIHLNISDILLLVMAAGKIIWLYTYQWIFGDGFCKIYSYLSMFALYMSTNIVVCIAIDRLRNVMTAEKMHRHYYGKMNPVMLLISCAWGFALICALPQLLFFQTVNIAPETSEGWYQCSDIWQIYAQTGEKGLPASFLANDAEKTYNFTHLVLVFWGPLVILVICYVLIATKLMQYSLRGVQSKQDSERYNGDRKDILNDTEDTHLMNSSPSIPLCQVYVEKPKTESVRFWSLPRSPRFSLAIPQQCETYRKSSISSPKVPTWRKQLRSKVFRTTLLVVATHVIFWFPYNYISLMKYINEDIHRSLNDNANIFKDLQILITLINPFLYGFSK